jgi:hypothetical protein
MLFYGTFYLKKKYVNFYLFNSLISIKKKFGNYIYLYLKSDLV